MKRTGLILAAALLLAPAFLPKALVAPLGAAAPGAALSPVEQAAAFRGAGFLMVRGKWQACGDPGTESYMPGTIEAVRDLNGDGLPEAVIIEGSGFCFGAAGTGYWLMSQRPDQTWKVMSRGQGIVQVLPTRGAAKWPDIEIGGPGFCFQVLRWNGRAYVHNRYQYEGRACRP
ncbi:hypothetical protein H7F51_05490 [Novosphingobium flavum]|uniref:Uncharacterized protein n=1 Tax=Novosphingobium flavum TaxID=1778672 RepID=A0A7X1FQ88_9SPHN|nr:hypothetical protein [Novosphingobium flavum]MBC2664960.1 hypothetical protein [Novosphingobium flavum]